MLGSTWICEYAKLQILTYLKKYFKYQENKNNIKIFIVSVGIKKSIKKMTLIFPIGVNDFKLINKIWLVSTKGEYDLASLIENQVNMLFTIVKTQRDL